MHTQFPGYEFSVPSFFFRVNTRSTCLEDSLPAESEKFSALNRDKYLTRLNSILPYLIIIVYLRRISSTFCAYSNSPFEFGNFRAGLGTSPAWNLYGHASHTWNGGRIAFRRKCRRSAGKILFYFVINAQLGQPTQHFAISPISIPPEILRDVVTYIWQVFPRKARKFALVAECIMHPRALLHTPFFVTDRYACDWLRVVKFHVVFGSG
jgi:hypothetical protein